MKRPPDFDLNVIRPPEVGGGYKTFSAADRSTWGRLDNLADWWVISADIRLIENCKQVSKSVSLKMLKKYLPPDTNPQWVDFDAIVKVMSPSLVRVRQTRLFLLDRFVQVPNEMWRWNVFDFSSKNVRNRWWFSQTSSKSSDIDGILSWEKSTGVWLTKVWFSRWWSGLIRMAGSAKCLIPISPPPKMAPSLDFKMAPVRRLRHKVNSDGLT